MISPARLLFGRLLDAVAFKRLTGVLHLVVVLPEGTPITIPAAATGVFGEGGSSRAQDTTLEGIRRLRALLEAMPSSHRRSGQTRK